MFAIPLWIMNIWKYRTVAVYGLLVLALTGMALLSHYRLVQLEKERERRVVAEAALQRAHDAFAAQIAAMKITMEETDERNAWLQDELAKVNKARGTTDDGLLAPVLRDALDGLRKRARPGTEKLRDRPRLHSLPGARRTGNADTGGRGRRPARPSGCLGGLLEETEPGSGHYRCVMLAVKKPETLTG